ncbi:MAG: hypothetical protein KKG70_17640 [Proteobacteria bacterium]|nr:hypothetical protein [Pseudomonadota bacterium]
MKTESKTYLSLLELNVVILNLIALASCQPSQKITAKDITEVMRLTLERALAAQEIPDYDLIEDTANIVLSSENVNPSLLPQISGVTLTLLSPEQIQEKADRQGDFLYLRFKEITVEDSKIIVSLESAWAIGKNSTTAYLSGGGFTVEYHRKDGKWVGEVTVTWIS